MITPYSLTKREQFIANNPRLTFSHLAVQLNTSLYAIERSHSSMLEKKAKARGLAALNATRAEAGLSPFQAVPPMWWRRFRQEFVTPAEHRPTQRLRFPKRKFDRRRRRCDWYHMTKTQTKIEFVFGVGEDANGQALPASRVKAAFATIQARAALLFGGFTLLRSVGGWMNDESRMVTEPGYNLFVLADGAVNEYKVQNMTDTIRIWLSQKSVVVIRTRVSFQFVTQ